MQLFMFYVLATVAIVAGIFVISLKNPLSSAISLVVTLGAVAGLFVLRDAHFLATIQILVYAGAIMVLFVFVIMLLNLHPSELGAPQVTPLKFIGGGLAGIGSVLLLVRFSKASGPLPPVGDDFGTLELVGSKLFSENLIPFEIVSVLLTAAIVGAVVIAKKEL